VQISQTIGRYLVSEVSQYTALGMMAATPVVLIPNLFDRADEFLVSGITAGDQFEIALCVIPMIVAYALPISFLFGVMMALGRLSSDHEIAAMRCCGFGMASLLVPVVTLGVMVSALTGYLMMDVEPRARKELVALSLRIAARGSLIEEGRFIPFGRRMIFVQRRDDENLRGIMISDSAEKERTFHVFAESGRFDFDPESGDLTITLTEGDMRMLPDPSNAFEEYRISFEEFAYTFRAMAMGHGKLRYKMDQLRLTELRDAVASLESGEKRRDLKYTASRIYETQMHRILSIPLASALFSLIGVPLGVHGLVRSRSWGMILALGLLSGYYSLFAYVQEAARLGEAPVFMFVWIPNALLLLLGSFLVWNVRRVR
jgi:lipopolysaccharide export LptBFGC system permease protein LptF